MSTRDLTDNDGWLVGWLGGWMNGMTPLQKYCTVVRTGAPIDNLHFWSTPYRPIVWLFVLDPGPVGEYSKFKCRAFDDRR